MLSNGQEIILFVILLILGLIYLNKYLGKHKVVINKFVFTASILNAIAIIFLQESSININLVIWALYIIAILFYKIVKDKEYGFINFSLFLGVNILCITRLDILSRIIHLLFLDKELIIKNIFIIIGSGLTGGFLYTFFKEYNFRKYEIEIDKFVFIASTVRFILMFLMSRYDDPNVGTDNVVLIWVLYLAVILFHFLKEEEYEFDCFLLFIAVNIVSTKILFTVFIEIYMLFINSTIGKMIVGIFFVIIIGLTSGFFYQFFKKNQYK